MDYQDDRDHNGPPPHDGEEIEMELDEYTHIVREIERASLAAHGTTNPHCSDETLTLPDLVGWEEE